MNRLIYMDNAATTSVKPEVVESMLPYFTEEYANPSSIYNFAQKTKNAVEDARTVIADMLSADKPNEIYFTAGGSIGAAIGALGGPVTSGLGATIGGAIGCLAGLFSD